jgi:hypothetical protein
VPISEEHHHHKVFENSYVRVWEVEVPARESTLLHRHDHDYVYLVLGDADITNAVAGKEPVKLHLADTTVNFSPVLSHVAENDAGTPFRNITIELLHPQGAPKKLYATMNAALASPGMQATAPAAAAPATPAQSATMLETDELRVSTADVASGASWSPPAGHDHLVVLPDKMNNSSAPRQPDAPMFPEGMVNWVPANGSWSVHNDGPQPMKVLMLEFTDSGGN